MPGGIAIAWLLALSTPGCGRSEFLAIGIDDGTEFELLFTSDGRGVSEPYRAICSRTP